MWIFSLMFYSCCWFTTACCSRSFDRQRWSEISVCSSSFGFLCSRLCDSLQVRICKVKVWWERSAGDGTAGGHADFSSLFHLSFHLDNWNAASSVLDLFLFPFSSLDPTFSSLDPTLFLYYSNNIYLYYYFISSFAFIFFHFLLHRLSLCSFLSLTSLLLLSLYIPSLVPFECFCTHPCVRASGVYLSLPANFLHFLLLHVLPLCFPVL